MKYSLINLFNTLLLLVYYENLLKRLKPEDKVKSLLIRSWMLEYHLNQLNEIERMMSISLY